MDKRNQEKFYAIETLNSFSELDYKGWDGYNSEPLSQFVIDHSKEILNRFEYIPDVFPLSFKGVQFEWEDEKYYLELEVRVDKSYHLFCMLNEETLFDFETNDLDVVSVKIKEVFEVMSL